MSDNFIEEIKEDVRYDQLLAIWREYGNVIIGAILAIIISTIGYLFWHSHQENKLQEQTLLYEKNLSLLENKSQQPDFSPLVKEGTLGYKIMGLFEQARAAASDKEAGDLLKTIANDASVDVFYRQLAEVQMVMKKFDSTNGNDLLTELDPLSKVESPVQAAVFELQGFAHYKLGNQKVAIQSFAAVASHPMAPQSMKIRARAMLEILTAAK